MTPDPDLDAAQRAEEITLPEKPFNTFRWAATVAVLGLLGVNSLLVDVDLAKLLDLPERVWFYGDLMFTPPQSEELPNAVEAMVESLGMAWIGMIIGAVLSFPLGFLASNNLFSRPVVFVTRQVLNVFRAIPEIAFLILFVPLLNLTPVTVAAALGVSSIGTLGKLSAEVIEGIDRGPVEAADAVGGSRWQRIRWAVVPQVIPEIVSLWLYRFEINIRNSAVAGAVGAGGIGTLIVNQIGMLRDWPAAGTSLIVMVVITLVVDSVSGRLRRRIIRGPTRAVDVGAAQTPAPDVEDRTAERLLRA